MKVTKKQVRLSEGSDDDLKICADCSMWLNKNLAHDCRPDIPVCCTFTGQHYSEAYFDRSDVPNFDSGSDFLSGDWQFEFLSPQKRLKIVRKAKLNVKKYHVRVRFSKGGNQ